MHFKIRKKHFYTIIVICLITYGICMFAIPLKDGGLHQMLKVLEDWQTFNAAMIALGAAMLSAYITIDKSEEERERDKENQEANERRYEDSKATEKEKYAQQRKREFIAAKAFLPHILGEIQTYTDTCIKTLYPTLLNVQFNNQLNEDEIKELNNKFKSINIPQNFEKVFQDCIIFGDEDESKAITKLLTDFQIVKSRMSLFKDSVDHNSYTINLATEIFITALFFSLKVSGFYDFAREDKPIIKPASDPKNYYNFLSRLDIKNNAWGGIEKGQYLMLDKKINNYCNLDYIKSTI